MEDEIEIRGFVPYLDELSIKADRMDSSGHSSSAEWMGKLPAVRKRSHLLATARITNACALRGATKY